MAAYTKIRWNLIHLDAERMRRRGDKPMTGAEQLDELEWLLDMGDHPIHAAMKLGSTPTALAMAARRHGHGDTANLMDALSKREANRASAA